eukprot:GFYU01020842.1.p2 GENE.GFYU01020842.1~~GFYU01020842.1.p2  ORF type:complete len:117 (+),score=10.96 GFYU01020842.1:136-486(+)
MVVATVKGHPSQRTMTVLYALVVLCCVVGLGQCYLPTIESDAIKSLYALNGPKWVTNTNWPDGDVCSFYGITCVPATKVANGATACFFEYFTGEYRCAESVTSSLGSDVAVTVVMM